METIGERTNGRRILLAATLLLLAHAFLGLGEARAQWTTNGNDISNTNTGNVGAGTSSPSAALHVKGNLFSQLTGTVSVAQNSATVTGAGTSFTTQFAAGDSIRIGSEVFTVSSISSNTLLTLDSNYLGASASGLTAFRDPNLFAVDNGDGVNKLAVSRSGKVGVGVTSPGVMLDVSGAAAPNSFILRVANTVQGGEILQAVNNLGNEVGSLRTDTASNGFLSLNDASGTRKVLLTSYSDGYLIGGNVGIGTTTPVYKLDIAGQVRSSSGGFVFPDGTAQATAASQNIFKSVGNAAGAAQFSAVSNADTLRFEGTGGTTVSFDAANRKVVINSSAASGWTDGGASVSVTNGAAKVGLGASNPTAGLDVQTPVSGATANGVRLQQTLTPQVNDGTLNALYINPTFNDGVAVRNTHNALATEAGNVGLGTTATRAGLDVQNAGVASPPDGVTYGARFKQTLTSAGNNAVSTAVMIDPTFTDGQAVGVRHNGLVVTSGNVGIGTAAPLQRLQIGSNSITGSTTPDAISLGATYSITPGANPKLRLFDDGANSVYGLGTSDHQFDFITPSATSYVWSVGGVEKMRLDASGGLGIGKTAGTAYKLDVDGSVNASGLCLSDGCKSNWSQVGGQWSANSGGTGINYGGGNVGIGTSAPNTAKLVIVGSPGASGIDLASSDVYAEMRVIRNSIGSADKDLYLQYAAGAGSKTHIYSSNVETVTVSGGKVGVGKTNPTEALDVVGNIKATGSVSATYQDVAEWVPSTQRLQAGTVVVLDAARTNHVLASTKSYDTGVAGVISDSPGVILGVGGADKLKVATTGRVKVRVDATRAPIRVGDLLVTSDVEGVAMKSVEVDLGGVKIHRPGTIVGKALEPLASGTGEILVLLSLQ